MEKGILLPSAGLSYSDIIYRKQADLNLLLNLADPYAYNSVTEQMIAVLKPYLNIDPVELYLQDLYYVWFDVLSPLIDLEQHKTSKMCIHCNHANTVAIDMSSIDIEFLKSKNEHIVLKQDNWSVTYRRRKAKDNLLFGAQHFRLQGEENPDMFNASIIEYLKPQIISFEYEGQESGMEFFEQWMLTLRKMQLLDVYVGMNAPDFGFKQEIQYSCQKCKEMNDTPVMDDFQNSIIYVDEHMDTGDLYDNYKNVLELARLPCFTLEDVKKLPVQHISVISDVLKNIEFQSIM